MSTLTIMLAVANVSFFLPRQSELNQNRTFIERVIVSYRKLLKKIIIYILKPVLQIPNVS